MITINIDKAKQVSLQYINELSLFETRHRNEKELSGLTNVFSSEEWIAFLSTTRSNIETAATTEEIKNILSSFDTQIKANK